MHSQDVSSDEPYRLMIVDDEPIVRQGIRDRMDWRSLGFCVVADCQDGREAIERLGAAQPDVVLTDIYMPFVDGLKLAGHVRRECPRARVVILTGYDDFEYARSALQLNVRDYLLKPVTPSELRELFTRLRTELDEARARERDVQRMRALLAENLPLIKGRLLSRLLSGELAPRGEAAEKLAHFGIRFTAERYIVAVLDVDEAFGGEGGAGWEAKEKPDRGGGGALPGSPAGALLTREAGALPNQPGALTQSEPGALTGSEPGEAAFPEGARRELTRFALFDCVERLAGERGMVFRSAEEHTVVILTESRPDAPEGVRGDSALGAQTDLESTALALCRATQREIERHFALTVSAGIGAPCPSMDGLRGSYLGARRALERRFVTGSNRVSLASEVPHAHGEFDARGEERMFLASLKTGDVGAMASSLEVYFDGLRKNELPVEKCRLMVLQLLFAVFRALEEMGIDAAGIGCEQAALMREVERQPNLDACRAWLLALGTRIADYLARAREDFTAKVTERALHYIQTHYPNPDLTVQDVCNYLSISPSYFSRIMKSQTGETFMESLIGERMRRAMELLNTTNLKAYEIAERVGYSDPNYFSLAFKKYYGKTPSAVRIK